jgi:REP element-mobilizing transposase RayT
MTRPLRVEYSDAYYHVINRGNNQEKIFKNDRDKEKFLQYLEKAAERFSIIFHSYCLMDNHYHLLVQTPDANLSKAMQWINVSYAAYFNRKRDRHGHLFQGRFKAILIDAKAVENPNKQVSEGFLLGDVDFVKWVKETFLSGRNDEKEIPQLKKLKPRMAIDNVVQAVAEQYSCSKD